MKPDQRKHKGDENTERKPQERTHKFSKSIAVLKDIGEVCESILAILAVISAPVMGFIWIRNHSAWAYWASLSICPIAVLLCVRKLKFKNFKPIPGFIVTLGACTLIAVFLPPTKLAEDVQPAFRAIVKTSFNVRNVRDYPVCWLVQTITNREIASPVHFMMYIRFTNLKTNSFMIESYAMGVGMTNGVWQTAPIIDLGVGQLYLVGETSERGLARAREVRLTGEDFTALIRNRNISPNETVQGWIGCEAPVGDLEGSIFMFRVLDANSGVTYLELVHSRESVIANDIDAQTAQLLFLGERDISAIHKALYSTVPKTIQIKKPN